MFDLHRLAFSVAHPKCPSHGIRSASVRSAPSNVEADFFALRIYINIYRYSLECCDCVWAPRVASLRANNGNGSIHVKKRTIDLNVYFSIRFVVLILFVYVLFIQFTYVNVNVHKYVVYEVPTYFHLHALLSVFIRNMQASSDNRSSNSAHTYINKKEAPEHTERLADGQTKREAKHGKQQHVSYNIISLTRHRWELDSSSTVLRTISFFSRCCFASTAQNFPSVPDIRSPETDVRREARRRMRNFCICVCWYWSIKRGSRTIRKKKKKRENERNNTFILKIKTSGREAGSRIFVLFRCANA